MSTSPFPRRLVLASLVLAWIASVPARSDEHLFGYVRGAETMPQGSWELYEVVTSRLGKGSGTYRAFDFLTEVEYGVTDRFSVLGEFLLQSVTTRGLLVDAYIPKDESYFLKPAGLGTAMKYNFLSPAKDDFGLSARFALDYSWRDRHSGQDKDSISTELDFIFQKYFLEGEMTWVANVGTEATHSTRDEIADLPPGFEWPTTPEMEIELKAGTGLSYRFFPKWSFGGEILYETEYETEVEQERWSLFAGPSIHFGSQSWWWTLTWLPQLKGGGQTPQIHESLHLVEKTVQEVRLKIGFNF